jgi:hypothetical protein
MKPEKSNFVLTSVTIPRVFTDDGVSDEGLKSLKSTEGYVCGNDDKDEYTVEQGSPAHDKAVRLVNAFLDPNSSQEK